MEIQHFDYKSLNQLRWEGIQKVAELLNRKPDEHILLIGDSRFWAILTGLKDWEYKLSTSHIKAVYEPYICDNIILHYRNGVLENKFKIEYGDN